MHTYHTIQCVREALQHEKEKGHTIALVPTMGNLHEGHIALVETAKKVADTVVVSIFVNPMQFGPTEDFRTYPRTIEADTTKLKAAGVTYLFSPPVEEMYPNNQSSMTHISVPQLAQHHCGAFRPTHFDGVCTVVAMLFNIIQPNFAVFGQKDYQQLTIIKQFVKDLFIPTQIISEPTLREADGLAMSSRNGYLTDQERSIAPKLFEQLTITKETCLNGQRDYRQVEQESIQALGMHGFKTQYFSICQQDTLLPGNENDNNLVILTAAKLGKTRLIDNVMLEIA